MSNRTEWEDIAVHVHQRDGSISMELNGEGPLRVGSGIKHTPDADPRVSLSASTESDDDTLRSAVVNLHFSPETARELGEWLIEHADDEPEDVLWGDGE
jgi:hypothetical protein